MTPDEITNKWIGAVLPSDSRAVREATASIIAGLRADIEQAIYTAVEEEREACAKIAEENGGNGEWYIHVFADNVAEEIRARSNHGGTK